jgi:sugar transferase EpsL
MSFYRLIGKRLFDLIVGGIATVVLLPLALLVGLVVRIGLGSPCIFRQERPGRDGIPFTLLKFRTMAPAENSVSVTDAERLTWLGRLLRGTSLDELPELINVLRGEMSLVGPRPLLMQYMDRYEEWQKHRHDVLPGITGWAQVNGRNAISWDEKFTYDVWYAEHVSFSLDVRILLMTVKQVIVRNGISAPGEATMPEFRGSVGPVASKREPESPGNGS